VFIRVVHLFLLGGWTSHSRSVEKHPSSISDPVGQLLYSLPGDRPELTCKRKEMKKQKILIALDGTDKHKRVTVK
jgi:hypothetical protein